MKVYLVKDQDGKVSQMHCKGDPSSLLPEGWSVVANEDKADAQAAWDASKLNYARERKLDLVRAQRDAKLKRVDILSNVAYLNAWSVAERNELKSYRQLLLDITDQWKDNMSALDSLDLNAINWPTEPSES